MPDGAALLIDLGDLCTVYAVGSAAQPDGPSISVGALDTEKAAAMVETVGGIHTVEEMMTRVLVEARNPTGFELLDPNAARWVPLKEGIALPPHLDDSPTGRVDA